MWCAAVVQRTYGVRAGGRAAVGWVGPQVVGVQWWLNHEQRMNWDMIPELNQQYKWGFMGFTCGP